MTNYHDIQFANNAYGTLSQAYATTATSIVLTTGHGARFPTLTGCLLYTSPSPRD